MGNIILQREGRFDKAMISVHKSMENNTTNVTLLADLVFYSFELGMTDIVAEYREKLGQAFPQSREYGIATSLYSILKEDVDLFNTAILAQVEQYNVIVPEPQFYGSLYAYVEIGGDAERVIKQFQKFEPALLSDTLTTLTAQGYMVAAPLMGILHASTNGEQLKRLVNAFCAYGERLETEDRSGPNYRRYISNRMFCYMSKGNLDEAFPYFETYYQELSPVFFDYYILFNSGVITEAMSDPRYAAIRDTIKVRIEDQKENLRQYFAESE
jgi:tetratricopeptide (TPR) repeat protein